jgi:hypothetical protein
MTTLLDQVPAAFERVRRELVLARFIGKLAVDQGVRELRSRVDDLVGGHDLSQETSGDASESEVELTDAIETSMDNGVTDAVPAAEDLAIADYDHLPASDVVALLDGLEPAERSAIETYERARRHRRTVLGKLDQLRGGEG